jgi:hypothetical protein
VPAFQVFQFLRLANLKKRTTEYDKKNTSTAGRRAEIISVTPQRIFLPSREANRFSATQ